MQTPPPEWSDAALDAEPVLGHRGLRRLGWVAVGVLVVALLAVLPPLINVGRYQHRVAQGISDSIGRPVHFDAIHLHLLPLPGLTIQNFVVQEDPAFGVEPAMRANTVEARLRLGSLWRRRIEVSRIVFESPSINLVRRADGRWNLQGVVSQAGTLASAPTAQKRAGDEPRFPYVEATDARINIKTGETKLPWSLVDANLALWLPDASEWRVRLRGRPLRTDTDVSDVGELHLEGSLGRSANGAAGLMDQPLAISARWESTPLGETTKLLLGRDTGFRGAASAELEVRGTPARMRLNTELHLHNLRRADFVPRLPMSVNAHCEADALSGVHALHDVRCAIPTAQTTGLLEGVFRSADEHVLQAPDVIAITGDVPDVSHLEGATGSVELKDGKPDYFLNWLRVFSSRIPEHVSAAGTVALHADWNAAGMTSGWNLGAVCTCDLSPAFTPQSPDAGTEPSASQEHSTPWTIQVLHTSLGDTDQRTVPAAVSIVATHSAQPVPDATSPMMERARTGPAIVAQLSGAGASVHYGTAALEQYAASLLPPLGDDLPADLATESTQALTSERAWGQPQQWQVEAAVKAAPARPRHRR